MGLERLEYEMINEKQGESKKQILLVEREHYLRKYLTQALKFGLGDDFDISSCSFPEQAISLTSSQDFDLIICDSYYPRMTGLDLVSRIRLDKPNLAAILFSNFSPELLDSKTLQLFDAIITKPFKLVKFLVIVRNILGITGGNQAKVANPRPSISSDKDLKSIDQKEIPTFPKSNTKSIYSVLILEDDPNARRIYRKALKNERYQVFEAGNLYEGRELLDTNRFDILICDVHLGRERGTDLISERRDQLKQNGTHTIIVSAFGQYRYQTEELGADFFLEKPISIGTLLQLLERLTNNQNKSGSISKS